MNQVYIDKLIETMKENNMDAMLISPSAELKFFLGERSDALRAFSGTVYKNRRRDVLCMQSSLWRRDEKFPSGIHSGIYMV